MRLLELQVKVVENKQTNKQKSVLINLKKQQQILNCSAGCWSFKPKWLRANKQTERQFFCINLKKQHQILTRSPGCWSFKPEWLRAKQANKTQQVLLLLLKKIAPNLYLFIRLLELQAKVAESTHTYTQNNKTIGWEQTNRKTIFLY